MNKFKYILLLSVVSYSFSIYTMDNSNNGSQISAYTTSDDLARESFAAITSSQDLPKLSSQFCEHVISCAPNALEKHVKLLKNPRIRAELMPDAIIMHGPTGSGKTTLGRVILQQIGAPFFILKAGMLGSEFANSRSSGIRRVGQLLRAMKANLMIDEIDRLAKKKQRQSGQENEPEDDTPEALWQLFDDMEQERLLLIGTSNCLENMPPQLQSRFEGFLYHVPVILNMPKITEEIVQFHLQGKPIESEGVRQELCKRADGLSNRQVLKIVKLSYALALQRNENSPVITSNDVINACNKLSQDRKFLAQTRWNRKDIFNYAVQTIGAAANLASIINMGLSLYNANHSLYLQRQGLNLQSQALNIQQNSLWWQRLNMGLSLLNPIALFFGKPA